VKSNMFVGIKIGYVYKLMFGSKIYTHTHYLFLNQLCPL